MEWRRKFDCDEYCNWLAVGHAISLMCDGVRPYLEQKMKDFQTQLQLAVGAGTKCHCIHSPSRRYNPWHDIVNCRWAAAIQNYYIGNPKKISWHQSNSNVWEDPMNGSWEIAKLFMSDLGPNSHLVTDAMSTDPTGLISLTLRCGYLGIPQPLTEGIRETRNVKWAHAPDQKLSNADKIDAFTSIKNFLKHREFAATPEVATYLQQIEEFETRDLVFLEERELEVLQDLRNLRENENRQLTETITSIQRSVRNVEESLHRNGESNFKIITLTFLLLLGKLLGEVRQRSRILLLFICVTCCIKTLGHGVVSEGCSFQQGENSTFQEFDFTSSLQLAREHFTGRQWLFRQIEEKFEDNDTKAGVLVTGAPGSGKSALMAQLICSRTSSIFIHNNIIGYHICSYSNKETQNVVKFVRNMVHMIAQRVTKYKQIITRNAFIKEKLIYLCPINPAACFRKVVLDPLEQIEDQNLTIGFRYIVIDALDECTPSDTQGASDILTMIRKHLPTLPRSVKMILTSRPMPRILKLHFVAIVDINPSDPKNIDDIDSYIARRVYMKYSSFVAFSLRVMSGIDDRQNLLKIMNKLVKQSQGNFLFAREVIQFCLTTPTENYGSSFLPLTLGDIYQKYFERAFPTRSSFTSVRPILELLVAAAVPLKSKDMFTMIVNEDNSEIKFEYEFESNLYQLSHFLRFDRTTRTVNLYHKALADWLTSSDMKGELYYVYKQEGCRLLASYFLNRFIQEQLPVTADMVIQVAKYISCAGKLKKHIEMFKSLPSHKIRSLKTSRESLLHTATLTEDAFVSKLIIYHFKDVNIVDRKGFTPAFLATVHGLLENLETFYKAGADINHVSNPCPNDATKTLEELYPKVLNWGKLLKRRFCHLTMIRAAIVGSHVRIVRFLIEKGVNLDDQSKVWSFGSVLDLAAEIGNLTIVQLLYNSWKKDAGSSLRYATQNNRTSIVKYFLENRVQDKCVSCERVNMYTFPNSPGQGVYYRESHIIDCETALHIAVRKDFTQLVQLFLTHGGTALNCPNRNGLLPVHYAVLASNSEIVQLLSSIGANINAPCHQKLSTSTPFSNIHPLEQEKRFNTSCKCDMNPLHFAAKFGLAEVLNILIDNGANILGRDCNGSTALHIAACHNQFAIFKILVNKGTDPNARSFNGSTPFHSAALCAAKEMFVPIHKMGANAYLRDNNQMTVIHYSALFRESKEPVVPPKQYNLSGFSEKWVKSFMFLVVFVDSTDLVSAVDNNGQTVLHILAKCGLAPAVVIVLKEAGVKKEEMLNAKDNLGNTAIDLALARVNELVSQSRLYTGEVVSHSFIPRLSLSGDYDFVISRLIKEMNTTENISYFAQVMAYPLPLTISTFFKQEANGYIKTTNNTLKYLLAYLRNWLNKIVFLIPRNNISISVICDKPFNQSVFHLLAWRLTDFAMWLCQMDGKWSTRGTDYVSLETWKLLHPYFYKTSAAVNHSCLNSVLTAKEKEKGFLGSCLDREGFSPLHRAAQGSNLLAVQEFMALDVDIFTKTRQGFDALELSILYSVKVKLRHSVDLTFENTKHALDIAILDIKLASKVAIILLRQALKRGFTLRCNKGLTVYHYAASRGMVEFIKALFEELNLSQDDRICEDKNRVTPLYLSKLYDTFFLKHHRYNSVPLNYNPWTKVITFIKGNGNDRTFNLKKTAELFLVYNYLYRDFNQPFKPNLTLEIIQGLAANLKINECKTRCLHLSSIFTLDNLAIVQLKNAIAILMNLVRIVSGAVDNTNNCISTEYEVKVKKPLNECLLVNLSRMDTRFMGTSRFSSSLLFEFSSKVVNREMIMSVFLQCVTNTLLNAKQLFYKYIYTFARQPSIISTILKNLRMIKLLTKCRYVISHGTYIVSTFTAYVRQQEATQGTFIPKITELIRNRMDWHDLTDEHVWPLPFLVRMINNDTARYDYLKTLNVGI